MHELGTVRNLLAAGKYREAERILNRLLKENRDNDELWYFLGILAAKLNNHDSAQEYLERAITLKKKPEYLWFRGMAYMEIFEIEQAIEAFEELLKIDAKNIDANFFLSICYLLLDDSRSEKYLKMAYELDKRKTKRLLKNFFDVFVSRAPAITENMKLKIEKELKTL